MQIKGYRDYKRREYCNNIKCEIQLLLNEQEPKSVQYEKIRELCKKSCAHTTYEFHHWLIEQGFLLVKPEMLDDSSGGV